MDKYTSPNIMKSNRLFKIPKNNSLFLYKKDTGAT